MLKYIKITSYLTRDQMNTKCQNNIDLINKMKEQDLILPFSEDINIYNKSLTLYGKKISNRIGIQPLEGFDSDLDGSPTDMVQRRYLRFVTGGAGLIWFEACAVSDNGKSNPHQMSITANNWSKFKELIQLMDDTSIASNQAPTFKVLQLTHSGRVSKDSNWNPMPIAARKSKEELNSENVPYIISDEQIKQVVNDHIEAAKLAANAGFDAVDIKVCHGYLLSELLSGFNRPGIYGGSFENRTRALFEIIDGINNLDIKPIGIAVRLNAFDSDPFPYGYGIVKDGNNLKADLTETIHLCNLLNEKGVKLINISASSPSSRVFGLDPIDLAYKKYTSSTDLLTAVKLLKEQIPEVTFMCTGLSTFGSLAANIGAGGITDGWFDIAGFGRQALAYPEFANDILKHSYMDDKRTCVDCGNCFKLMDPGHCMTGCIVRDREIYFPLYQKNVLNRG